MNVERFLLNVSSVSVPTYYQMTKAKKAYVKEHPQCAMCGNKKYLEVHHVKPVHLFPESAIDQNNFITLCDPKNNGCHRWFGHFGNFRRGWNPYIRVFAYYIRELHEKCETGMKFDVPIDFKIGYYKDILPLCVPVEDLG